MNRSIQVEGAFGVLKQDYGFRRFLLRGKNNVKIEVMLMAFAYDINKLHNKTKQKRNGELLHKQVTWYKIQYIHKKGKVRVPFLYCTLK